MTFSAPLALAALAIPIAIYLVHWLFGTRRRVPVPALFLWTDLPRAQAGRSKRRVPPFSWLLLLQVATAAIAALALARPGVPADPPRHLALILDASATMQATDVAPSRFEAARRAALDRLHQLRPNDLVSLVRAGKTATLLASGTPDAVRGGLESAQPGRTASAIGDALALASRSMAETPDRAGQIVLLTDVAWSRTPNPVGRLAAPVEVVPTGGGSNNQAVASVVVRLDPNGLGQTAFVELDNEADRPARAPMRLTADGAPIDERQVDIAARSRATLSIPLPLDAHHIRVQLLGSDALGLDDVLDTIAPGGPHRAVAALGQVSDGLRRAIESVPSLQIQPAGSSQAADLTVLVRSLPGQLPRGPLLLIDPPSNSARLLGVGLGSGARIQPSHPLLQGLDLLALQDENPSVSSVPGWAHVVLGTRAGPLIMEGQLEGRPTVSLTFDPELSGLEKSLAYPLLINNATSFLFSESESPSNVAGVEPFDPAESDISPRPVPTFDSVGRSNVAAVPPTDVWPWLAAVALALLGVEWLVFARRG